MTQHRANQNSTDYRPAIDGMRAFSICSVLVFHMFPNLLPGGFVGVDIFFVISGYLITSILIRECREGNFSFGRFYQRRIARIFPSLFAVLAATLLAATMLYPGEEIASTGAVVTSALASLANIKFIMRGDYFKLAPDTERLLHTWSLSVEEQFYFAMPLLVYILTSQKSRESLRYTKRLGGAMAILILVSLCVCIFLTFWMRTWAYYLMPTRAWELLVGGIVATAHLLPYGINKRLSLIAGLGVLCGCVGP